MNCGCTYPAILPNTNNNIYKLNHSTKNSGGHSGEETPDPIPNSEVKLPSDLSCTVFRREPHDAARLLIFTHKIHALFSKNTLLYNINGEKDTSAPVV